MNEQKKRLPLATLTFLGFQINGYLEDGQHGLTFDHVYEGLDNGTLWDVLKQQIPNIDVSVFQGSKEQEGRAMIEALREAAEGMRQREARKYGVERGGLSLLMAYLIEAIQQGYWIPSR